MKRRNDPSSQREPMIEMDYELIRRHLDPVRDYFESQSRIRAISEDGNVNVKVEFLGAYMRNDILVLMARFDDSYLDTLEIERAYGVVRGHMKSLVRSQFPEIPEDKVAVHVLDTTSSIGDLEF